MLRRDRQQVLQPGTASHLIDALSHNAVTHVRPHRSARR
jgi:hypothetical protein